MNKKIKYTDPPDLPDFDQLKVVPDFLPPPEVLAQAPVLVKVTMAFNYDSLKFFQDYAREHGVSYQRMIRNLLDAYVEQVKLGQISDKENKLLLRDSEPASIIVRKQKRAAAQHKKTV